MPLFRRPSPFGMVAGMAITIRRAVLEDAEQLGEVGVKAWQWAYRGLMPDDVLDSLRPESRAKAWHRWLEDDVVPGFEAWVAELGDKIIGYAASAEARDIEEVAPGTMELQMIYLLEEHVGTGVGSQLIRRVEESWRRRGATGGILWMLKTNERTKLFYERHGWEADGTEGSHEITTGVEVPSIRMHKRLD